MLAQLHNSSKFSPNPSRIELVILRPKLPEIEISPETPDILENTVFS